MPKANFGKSKRNIYYQRGGGGGSKPNGSTEGSTVADHNEAPVDQKLKKVGLPEFDLTSVPVIQAQVDKTITTKITSRTNITPQSTVFQFIVNGDDYYINLKRSYFIIKYKWVGRDNENLVSKISAAKTGFRKDFPETNLFHTLWKSFEVLIDNKKIPSHNNDLYYMNAYFQTLFNYEEKDFDELFHTQRWEKDNHFDKEWSGEVATHKYDTIASREKRLIETNSATSELSMVGKPFHFLFDQPKCLPPRRNLEIIFEKSPEKIYLKSYGTTQEIALQITDIEFYLVKHKLALDSDLYIQKILQSGTTAKFPIHNRRELQYLNIPQGVRSFNNPVTFSGSNPTGLIIGLLDGRNFNGENKRSVFNFQNFNLATIYCEKNGVQYPSLKYAKLDYKNKAEKSHSAIVPWLELLNIGKKMDKRIDISYTNFCKDGYSLYYFDFTPDKGEANNGVEYFSFSNSSPIQIYFEFDEMTPSSIIAIMMPTFDGLLELGRDSLVRYNWLG